MNHLAIGRFVGKVALVTGGASGIGAACCQRFAREGAEVAIVDVDDGQGERAAEELRDTGRRVIYIRADVSSFESVDRAISIVREEFGRLDVAVNNAGVGGPMHSIIDIPLAQWTTTLAINLTGVFHCLRAELPLMATSGGGSIINVASIMGTVAAANLSAYVAAKHGVIGLTKVAAIEFGQQRIRVNAVGPTFVRTPLTAAMDEDGWKAMTLQHPLGYLPTALDVANIVSFLGSDEAHSITGSFHLVDAGYTAQ